MLRTKSISSGGKSLIIGQLRKYFPALLKLIGLCWSIYFVDVHLVHNPEFLQAMAFPLQLTASPVNILTGALLLGIMGLNWMLEAEKWRMIVRRIAVLSRAKALMSVLAGSGISLFAPNRSGEYLGRMLVIQGTQNRARAIALNFIGSYAQILVTFAFGCLGLRYFLYLNHYQEYIIGTVNFFSLLLCGILALGYFRIGLIERLIPRRGWLARVHSWTSGYEQFHTRELSAVLLLSILRYGVYSAQFLLMLRLFGVHIPLITGLLSLSMMYLAHMAIPTTALSEIGLRGSSAIWFFAQLTQSTAPVIAASYMIWMLNLFLPALAGWIIILRSGKSPQ